MQRRIRAAFAAISASTSRSRNLVRPAIEFALGEPDPNERLRSTDGSNAERDRWGVVAFELTRLTIEALRRDLVAAEKYLRQPIVKA